LRVTLLEERTVVEVAELREVVAEPLLPVERLVELVLLPVERLVVAVPEELRLVVAVPVLRLEEELLPVRLF
jgi:hypothetical protein